ncbi:MAG TPA: glucoamylase family protein [Burkholderiaceae bacterium]|nr:glucoamylase family protein [Burkholderiaceae bacterium]
MRSELFSADQMEQYGKTLAATHKITSRRWREPLLARLADNETKLVEVCNLLTESLSTYQRITPAGEWLIDNFHLIEEQIATAKRHLPRGYSRELPRLATGPSAGLPRVYDIALETISHGDGLVDAHRLSRFVAAYQTVTPLKLGELWAIPIMLRLALIENLRRVGVRMAGARADRDLANVWADQMMEMAESDPKSLILVIADMARSSPPLGSAFVAELTRRLQGQSPALALALTWIEQQLAESHLTIDQLVQLEAQLQASHQVSISNSIGSLRLLSAIDWREFVEQTSDVEKILRDDPAGVYAAMEFATRDSYRHATEQTARRSTLSESEVAAKAIELARSGVDKTDPRAAHVGFYLIDEGLPALSRAVGVKRSALYALRMFGRRHPLSIYLGTVVAITVTLTLGLTARVFPHVASPSPGDAASIALLAFVILLLLLATSQLALSFVNWLVTLLIKPRPLPRMDYSEGIAPKARTLVAVPTLLTDITGVEKLIESLEVRFLANRDAHLHFALLTDFPDADQETLPGDQALLQLARDGINALNKSYVTDPQSPVDIFYLLHRPRRWNPQQRAWMGRERKRGKLGDLNALLRGHPGDAFSVIVGNTEPLLQVKYVITLDTDTQLPRDSARQLVGAMAHPLNEPQFDRPHFDPAHPDREQRIKPQHVVTAGYGILQPRVAVSLPETRRSPYARLYSGEPGLDPYTRTVSDVYQDVFHEGSFIGKGIYDVDAFESALAHRFPENRILSHDLLEGCLARSGLLSDVQLYEQFPSRYSADVARRHRWIRGDWQLIGWLRHRVPLPDGSRVLNPLSWLSQWKIVDNLRRSLVPTSLLLLLLLGWAALPYPSLWTALVFAVLLLPALATSLTDLLRKPRQTSVEQHLIAVARTAQTQFMQSLLALAWLPYEAFYSVDAIVRTLWRALISHRQLLEWKPSSIVERQLEDSHSSDLSAVYQTMWIAPTIAVLTWTVMPAMNASALRIAAPVLLLWLVSPALAWWVSRPLAPRIDELSLAQVKFVRRLARRTWGFFETYVNAEENWLPPDNVQQKSGVVIAHRTSPTNVGLALLGDLTAHDLGYQTGGQFVLRTTNTMRVMQSLERHRGHFFNWYDTRTLAPLNPRYVSTVDSGNFVGSLLTLRVGLAALPDEPILHARWLGGIGDTFEVLREAIGSQLPPPVVRFAAALERAGVESASTLESIWSHIDRLANCAAEIAEHFLAQPVALPAPPVFAGPEVPDVADQHLVEVDGWAEALSRQCVGLRDELVWLAPWLATPESKTTAALDVKGAGAITLRALAAIDEAQDAEVSEAEKLLAQGVQRARERIAAIDALVQLAGALSEVDYAFLFDRVRRQFVIGYNVGTARADASYYDLLASEARLADFVAIAQGKLPQESWFALGRLLTSTGGEPVLLSWSGSMFEYLMPLLMMPTYENTLLDQTYHAAVERQIDYGRQRGVPWGISECGYNAVDTHDNYQYRAFGVPGLGLKRGLADDLVIAPYASALALMVAPTAACANLLRLADEGLYARFGMFEAIDYTPSRQRRGESSSIIQSFMAHHHGMSLLSFSHALLDRVMQKRFESDPHFKATLLLLQERVPRATPFYATATIAPDLDVSQASAEPPVRVLATPNTPVPEAHLLSNGRYHVMVTNAGGGSSRWKDFAITRWREDSTCDNWGMFCYLRDVSTGAFWSVAHQPTLRPTEHYEAIFTEGRAEFRRRDLDIETHTEIVVSPEDDIELRRVRITNRSRTRRTIEITSYAEMVLAPAAADALHTAFSNLFVQTEIIAGRAAILCTRRPRSRDEHTPISFQLMTVHGNAAVPSFETDRVRFIGRGGTVAAPRALLGRGALSGSAGSVLDPIASIRQQVTLEPSDSATVDIVCGVAETRDAVMGLIEKYQDRRLADRVFDLTWTHSQVVLRQLNATEADAQLYGRLASSVLYANASLRGASSVLMRNRRGQSALWGYAISGDLPIVLLQISKAASIDLVRQLVQAHAYWRLKGLAVDLVIWNEDHDVYRQQLQEQILGLIAAGVEAHFVDRPGGIFVRHAEQISNEDRLLFESVARVIISDARGTLAEQVNRRAPVDVRVPHLTPTRTYRPEPPLQPIIDDLILFNGLGGFTPDGREYVIAPPKGEATPAPWVNVLANPDFGTVVSESGEAYTWSTNAHLYRLTPWHNDLIDEANGEAIYIRDEETGKFWSPSSSAISAPDDIAPTVTRHGFGYSVFERIEDDIHSELTVFVALDASVKFSALKLTNRSDRPRRLSVTGYVEWVLGDLRTKSSMHVSTEIDARTGAIYARNPFNIEFAEWIGFFDIDDSARTVTGDRTEFIGRNRSWRNPAAMRRTRLSGRVGAALDPCAAMQVTFDLTPDQEREVVFRLGAANNVAAANALVQRFRGVATAHEALEAVLQHWRHTLGAVQIETPDAALNVLTNGWLIYQTMGCRLWARSGYYQSGGAYGFRDQLQDVMALIHTEPRATRAQIALCASRQFVEGDVQHWWHPPSGRGVRTHCSDDYLWLPLAVSRYVVSTGDRSILDETSRFLEGRPVNAEDDSYYDMPVRSDESADVYQHCVRAILHGLKFGEHGLPLIGSGDWNDGMNLIGMRGKGESVWLAFFLFYVLKQFAPIARIRGDTSFAARCEQEAAQLSMRIEQNAWDGDWYRRAYFDDGTPLGSKTNTECQIDSISQSWSVLSGAGDAERSRRGMDAVYARLVRRDHGLIQLLDPPFDKSDLDPGYIRGYVPGVRENGGQYTHAAIWTAMAFAALGDSRRAWELTSMINPVNHGVSAQATAIYKVEPYVVAADVYAVAPHTGRGGWTWYTGSAGWMYRLIVESLLGAKLEGNNLQIAPCLPSDWNEYKLTYRYRETEYRIAVRRFDTNEELPETTLVTVDGVSQDAGHIVLIDDRRPHDVEVRVAGIAVTREPLAAS